MRTPIALALLCVASIALADEALTVKEAKAAVKQLGEASKTMSPEQVGVLSASALAEPSGRLSTQWKNVFKAAARIDASMISAFAFEVLDEQAPAFVKQACKESRADLEKLSADAIWKMCDLKRYLRLPAVPKKSVGAVLLFAAATVDALQKQKASAEEITLATWLTNLGRAD